jgi:uncharacterized membrane protein YvbJ
MQDLQCFRCGSLNNFGNKFCTNCGERFQYSCPKCNAIVIPGVRFCSNCAAELAWDTTPQTTAVETTPEKQYETRLQDNTSSTAAERDYGPKRNTLPYIIVLALIIVVIVVIFVADIFLNF